MTIPQVSVPVPYVDTAQMIEVDRAMIEDYRAHVGELYLADISVPPGLYREPRLGLTVPPLFAESDVVRLR